MLALKIYTSKITKELNKIFRTRFRCANEPDQRENLISSFRRAIKIQRTTDEIGVSQRRKKLNYLNFEGLVLDRSSPLKRNKASSSLTQP